MPSRRQMLGFGALGLGMFLAILNVQIVAASLGPIRDGLKASADQISWVQTSYLIGEVLMIPLTGMLTRILSSRYLFMLSAGGFALASIGCALASSMDAMVVGRAIQGFMGGSMVPAIFVAVFRLFPDGRRGAAMAAVTVLGTLAPTFGPTLGGLVTAALSWHWLFLINIFPAPLIMLIGWYSINWDKPDWSLARHIDLTGTLLLTLALGAGIYVLEEGHRHGWFDSATIGMSSAVALVSALLLGLRLRFAPHPVLDMAPFRQPLFIIGSLYSTLIGVGLFGTVFLQVLFMDRVLHFDPVTIGVVMGVSGLAQLVLTPLVGWASDRVEPRLLLGLALACFLAASWWLAGVGTGWGQGDFTGPQVLRAIAISFIFPPVSFISFARVTPRLVPDASGIFNLVRMLGGAVAIAGLNSLISLREASHRTAGLLGPEALAHAFQDAFRLLLLLFALALLACFFLPALKRRT
ncbi:DHA2 family efflux MFS transporter permease subunit [Niveispirillum sp. BGYR6]|uniref:DHA2 family efflux MFS transporter permease subunit n=1 Tax=Niveispirillum sp. BGYR6 TaxID=2971249 RepID=UPI0022B9448E|nr:DHA2 family efflux MFS transporter permease subunit [Niveispirillum sp. BGYR6]MDG5496619.1 DHA2 family efflux MFS transporter permease subunit [Niveispirillum sp. BGYR6]